MKKIILLSSIAFASILLGCKKTPTDDILPKDEVEINTYQKADDASAKNELDKVNNDIETIYKSTDYANARVGEVKKVVLPCGKVTLNSKNFKIEYNDTVCGSKVMSGSVDVQLIKGNKFADTNAVLKVTFTDYKVYYNASKTSVTYNGIQYITNASGGSYADLIKTTTLIHKVRGDLQLKFDSAGTESDSRTWHIFRKKTFTSNGTATGVTFTLDGDTTIDGKTVIEYGDNKEGDPFVNEMTTAFHWENCGTTFEGPYVLKTGKVSHTATNDLGFLGVFKGIFTVEAGYSIGTGTLAYDGTCSSAGYKLSIEYRRNNELIGKQTQWFQEY
jgi:hypothetical protein